MFELPIRRQNINSIRYTERLQDVSRKDFLRVGGKGAGLGEMISAGLPIPVGFVLLTNSYQRFVTANNIGQEIDNLLREVDNDDPERLEDASYKIRQLFEQSEIPRDVLAAIDRAYEQIGSPEAAVRSSATVEDLQGASFAGQYDTFLNVKGKDDLYQCVKKCWGSLWNARALSYRLKQNIDHMGLTQGVVVQKLIDAEISGILFTANPINGRRDQMLLNASWGLGEAIVGGDVTPDQWILDRKNRQIAEEKTGTKEIMTGRKEAGTELLEVPEEKRKQVTLGQEEVLALLKLGEKAEEHFGFPQDIEWAFHESKFYLLQSRPITSLFPMPEPQETGEELRIYMNVMLYYQAMYAPLTPMGEDMWRKAYINAALNIKHRKKPVRWLKSTKGRLFIDLTEPCRYNIMWQALRNNPPSVDTEPITTKVLLQVLERNKGELLKHKKFAIKTIFEIATKINPWLIKFIIGSLPKTLYGVMSPQAATTKAFQYGNYQITAMKQDREKLQTREEKLEFIEHNIHKVIYMVPQGTLLYVMISFSNIDKARKILCKHAVDPLELDKVEKAVPHSVTTEMGMELLQIAQKLDQAGEQPAPDHPRIKQFLTKYGHRSCQEVDTGVPRWEEDTGYVVSLIQSYMDNKTYQEGTEKFYRDMEEAEKAIISITTKLKEKGAGRDAHKVERLMRNFRAMYGARELPKYFLTKGIGLLRDTLMEIGAELQAEGRLDHKKDIFFVRFQDIRSGGKLQELVKQNSEEYRRELQRTPVPRVMTSTGETIYSAIERESDHAIWGLPASPGAYEGTVRVLKHPEEGYRLKKGEILVTAATNPAWTPLFLKIGGLIMETGGPISHGSVVAREYGIPAVVAVREATTRFEDGQRVRIDGESGMIEILSPEK